MNKVLVLGLSRTGTKSLSCALNQLGIQCKHYPYDARTQRELASRNARLSILEQYQAIVDISVVPGYPALDRAYPGSKFILTVRDMDSWLVSLKRHLTNLYAHPHAHDAQFWSFTIQICQLVYGGMDGDSDHLRKAYQQT